MAKAGSPSKVHDKGAAQSAETRQRLVQAAMATLKQDGYAGSSARNIAERAGVNQGLIFYHFGSVASLLLAALDTTSAERLDHYTEAVAQTTNSSELVEAARHIFSEDLDAGYVTVLVEMIAGASATPGLGPEVAARLQPWVAFAEGAVAPILTNSPLGALLPAGDVAYGITALYLGLEMLSHLTGDRQPTMALFDHAAKLAGLLAAFTGTPPPPPKETP
jgi:AcrR family transcriptional regulator